MIVLGIDPGIGRMGWGVISREGNSTRPIDYGCLETPVGLEVSRRLLMLREKITQLIKDHSPEAMGIEDVFFNKNTKTALLTGQARGVIMETAAEWEIPVSSYTPLQIKLAVTGYGKADKEQVGTMMKMLLGLKAVPKPDDTADALAIALTCAFSNKKYLQ